MNSNAHILKQLAHISYCNIKIRRLNTSIFYIDFVLNWA
jgi:hypothetical protein